MDIMGIFVFSFSNPTDIILKIRSFALLFFFFFWGGEVRDCCPNQGCAPRPAEKAGLAPPQMANPAGRGGAGQGKVDLNPLKI